MNNIDMKQEDLKDMTREHPEFSELKDDLETGTYGPFDNIDDLIKALNS